jgi:hypothetical protein
MKLQQDMEERKEMEREYRRDKGWKRAGQRGVKYR